MLPLQGGPVPWTMSLVVTLTRREWTRHEKMGDPRFWGEPRVVPHGAKPTGGIQFVHASLSRDLRSGVHSIFSTPLRA